MGHRRSFRSGISQSQRRKKSWGGVFGYADDLNGLFLTTPSAGGPGSSLQLFALGSDENQAVVEGTILRIRGTIEITKSILQGPTTFTTDIHAFGIGMVTNEAAQNGAVPNPATATGVTSDIWMFLRTSTQIPVDIQGTIFDVKAQRKWESGMSLVFVLGSASDLPSGTSGGVVRLQSRILFLLP